MEENAKIQRRMTSFHLICPARTSTAVKEYRHTSLRWSANVNDVCKTSESISGTLHKNEHTRGIPSKMQTFALQSSLTTSV